MAENLHRGIVVSNADPEGKGRVRLRVPSVFGQTVTGWASSVLGGDVGPAAGTVVWVTFEAGDGSRPAYFSPEHDHPHDHPHDHGDETWFSDHEHSRLTVDAYTAATTPDQLPVGITFTTSSTGGGWPTDYVTIVTIKENEHRIYQQVTDKASRKWIRTGNGTTWASNFVQVSTLTATGGLALTDVLAITRTAGGNDITIQSPSPQIGFVDTDRTGGGKNWWFHVNGGVFYLLPDRDGNGSWESPYPLYVDANADVTLGTTVTHLKPTVHTHRVGDPHPTQRNVLNWGSNSSTLTGYLVIKTNMPGSYDMSHLHITGYSYNGAGSSQNNLLDLVVSGYLRPTTLVTVNGAYTNRGRPVDLVRWAKDASGNQVLIIGSPTDTWHYPQITVDWFKYRHSSAHPNTDFQGWTVGIETDISGYTLPYDVPNTTPGWALIDSFDPGGLAHNTVTTFFSGIPSHYTRLKVVVPWMSHASTSNSYLYIRFNGDSGTKYGNHLTYHTSGAPSGTYTSAGAQGQLIYAYFYGGAGRDTYLDMEIYQQASRVTLYDLQWGMPNSAASWLYGGNTKGVWNSTAKVSSIQIWGSLATTWSAGSRFYLYGATD